MGHYGSICFADLFRDRWFLDSLSRVATGSGPENTKICKNYIRYGDFGTKSPVPFTPPGPPPGTPPVLLPLAAWNAAFGGLSLSRLRFLSASAHVFTQCTQCVEACLVTSYLRYGDAVSGSSALCGVLGSSPRQASWPSLSTLPWNPCGSLAEKEASAPSRS